VQQMYDETLETSTVASQSDSSFQGDESTNCLLIPNDMGYTPLIVAIHAHAGWEVIGSLLRYECDTNALDDDNNNALHLLVSEDYKDPEAALAVLKARPTAATVRNDKGMLPIEVSS
jgi:ankyrin repeat protein